MGIHIDGPNSKITGDLSGNVTGVAATFTGNLGVGGVLTYEDVTNVDSIGIITARSGVHVGPTAGVGATIYTDGGARFSGIVTATALHGDGSNLTGISAGVSLSNGADNRVITATSASAITGEANLTFNGGATGDAQLTVHAEQNDSGADSELILETSNDFATSVIMFKDSTAEAGSVAYNHGDNYIKFSTNGTDGGTERMRISSLGHVTKPANPSFRATAGGALDYTSDNTIAFTNERHDIGGYYNNSNSYYTIPTTGYYKFEVMHYAQPGQVARVQLERSTDSGSSWSTVQIGPRIESSGSGRYIAGWMHVYTEFTATNIVRVRWSQGNVHVNNGYAWFQGWLMQ